MKAGTIRGIHSILPGAFAAAQPWERTGRNPPGSLAGHRRDTCAQIASYLDEIRAELVGLGVGLRDHAYLFFNHPVRSRPWNPD